MIDSRKNSRVSIKQKKSENKEEEEEEERILPKMDSINKEEEEERELAKTRQDKYPNVHPELHILNGLNKLIIKEKGNCCEVLKSWQQTHEFEVVHPGTGELLFEATEHSSCCNRYLAGWKRPFEMKVRLNSGELMCVVKRATGKCLGCFFFDGYCCCGCHAQNYLSDCARDEYSVYGNNEDDYYGKVQQAGSWFKPTYDIFNSNGELQFKVRGPCCNFSFCCCCSRKCREVRFQVLDPNTDQPVGVFFKDADDFVLEFPESLDVRMKTVLLSTLILIDIIYFDALCGRNSIAYLMHAAFGAGVALLLNSL